MDDFLKFTTDVDAQAWLAGEFGQWAEELRPELCAALVAYKNTDYDQLNRDARTGFETGAHLLVDEAIAAHALSAAVIAYRGIIDGQGRLHQLTQGATIQDDGYWSVSLLEEVAWGFASTGGRPETRIVLRISLDAGANVVPAAAPDLLEQMHEYELLLQRGSRFEVLEEPRLRYAEKAGGAPYYLIDVELMP